MPSALAGRRVLFLAFRFPPYNTIGAVRGGKLARHWHEGGVQVRVLSAAPQRIAETLPLEVPEEIVVRTPWIDVNALPAMALGGRKRVVEEGFGSSSRLVSRLGSVYRAVLNFPDGEIGWLPSLLKAGHRLVDEWRPDFIYATARPFSALLAARRLAQVHRIPWFAELRDLWTEHHFHPSPPVRRTLERRMERRTLGSASGIVTVSAPLAERLRRFGPPVEVVMNGFEAQDFPAESTRQPGPLRIVYTGMWYQGGQDLAPLFSALARVRGLAEVRVEFYGRTHQAALMALAEKHGVAECVEVSAPVPYRDSLALQRGADGLLLLLWARGTEKGILTGKLFEYLGARRPILAVGPADDEAATLIRDRKAGMAAADPEAIARWLTERAAEKAAGGIPDLPEATAMGLSRGEQFARLDRFIDRCLDKGVA